MANKIPPRSEMDKKYTWNAESVFPSDDAWEKEVKQIFQKFYRTRKAEASGESGFGIGLSIVEQIVTHHGGMIEVASKPGAGSRFTLVAWKIGESQ